MGSSNPYTYENHNFIRPYKFENKKYILIGCRVHAGETPSNYMLRGLINFLLVK